MNRLGWALLSKKLKPVFFLVWPILNFYMAHPTVIFFSKVFFHNFIKIESFIWRCQFRRNIKWLLVKTLKLQIRPINFKIWGIWVHFLKTKKCITGLLSLEPRGGNINRSRICCHNFPGWNNINSCSNISSFISFFLSLKMSSVANRSKNFTKPKGQCDPVQFSFFYMR